jgi:hypothetical protein
MNIPSFAWFRLRTPEHGCRFGESGCPLIVGKPQTRVTVQFVKTSAFVCTDRRKCPSSLSLPSIESLHGRVEMYTDILGRLRGPRRSEPDIFAVWSDPRTFFSVDTEILGFRFSRADPDTFDERRVPAQGISKRSGAALSFPASSSCTSSAHPSYCSIGHRLRCLDGHHSSKPTEMSDGSTFLRQPGPTR